MQCPSNGLPLLSGRRRTGGEKCWKPKVPKIYPLTIKEKEELNKFIDDNLEKGYIRPSESTILAPFFFVDKKDTTELRPIQDYATLNPVLAVRPNA